MLDDENRSRHEVAQCLEQKLPQRWYGIGARRVPVGCRRAPAGPATGAGGASGHVARVQQAPSKRAPASTARAAAAYAAAPIIAALSVRSAGGGTTTSIP